MKTTIILSLLSFAAISANAQCADKHAHTVNCKMEASMPANAVPAWPTSAYTPTQNPACPPCYEYTTKSGLKVMECHNLWFPPENSTTAAQHTTYTNMNGGGMETQRSYTGNYPAASCKKDPKMPANATLVFPTTEYTAVGNPACAPCYEYTTRRGLKVMECHNLLLPPANKQ